MIKVKWDKEELAALIDIYKNSAGKTPAQIDDELQKFSQVLIKRADKLGVTHDDKFRNLNGLKMMYQNVVYIDTDGQEGLSSTSILMQKVYDMSKKEPEKFEAILKEFKEKYC